MKKHLTTPTKLKAKRRLGFRRRIMTSSGRRVIKRRRHKGRRKLTI